MRTRLDEIVEEELKSWHASGGMDMDLFKRVAERAFRHGVEQMGAYMLSGRWAGTLETVQPAPASVMGVVGTPDGPQHEHRGYKCIHRNPATGTDTVYYLRGGGSVYFPDGRKGERRKPPGGICWHTRENWLCNLSVLDRERLAHGSSRSGKDRRGK